MAGTPRSRSEADGKPAGHERPAVDGPGGPADGELLWEAFHAGPHAGVVVADGRVVAANEALHRALGLSPGSAAGRLLLELLPPEDGLLPTPDPGATRSYRTHVNGVPARVDLAASTRARGDGALLVSGAVTLAQEAPDTAADRALLKLSRDLAEARTEDAITAALARALEVLFPERSFAIRLVDPKTLELTTLHASGRLRAQARGRLALRRAAVERTGLSLPALQAGSVAVVDEDEPLFEGCGRAAAVPVAVAGQLFGVVNLEYPDGGPGDPEADAPLLYQLANHAALGVRNVRSIEELTYLKTWLEDLLEHANALICVVSRCREVIVWNAALEKLTGVARAEATGEDVLRRVAPEERVRLEQVLLRSFAGERVDGFEARLLRADGGEARVALASAPVVGAAGEVEAVICIGQDLTLLRTLQAAAEHAERLAAIGRLVAGVVHELNNPLTAVTMYSEFLVEKLGREGRDPADVEKLKAVQEAGQRIQRLARDLVTYARPTGAKTEPVDLAAVVEEAARMANPALKESLAMLDRVVEPVPPMEGNRPSLVQVVLALLTNAAQATPEGGRVELTLSAADGAAVLRVRDQGPGMTPEVAARAFEPFFSTRAIGIGLGLTIVAGIVERHGGKVALDTAPGLGTTVTVTLPVR